MFDAGIKTYMNLKVPGVEPEKEADNMGLLSRTKPMPEKVNEQPDNELVRVGKYVSQIRAKREAAKNA